MISGKWNKSIGVGYVILPTGNSGEERIKYINDCIRRSRVTLLLEDGAGIAHDCYVSKHVIKDIDFPLGENQTGSCVLWMNIPGKNTPIVTAIFSKEDESLSFKEGDLLLTKTGVDSGFQVLGNKDGKVSINVRSNDGSNIILNAISKAKNALVKLFSNGTINILSDGNIEIKSFDSITLKYSNVEEEKESNFTVLSNGDIKITPYNTLIFFEGSEPIVLGETFKKKLERLLDGLIQLTVTTPSGVSGTPINASVFSTIKNELSEILSTKVKTD